MKGQKRHDWPTLGSTTVLLLSVGLALFTLVREHFVRGPEGHFAFCLSVVLVVVVTTAHATAATVRAKPAAIYRVADWAMVLVAVSVLVDLLAVPVLGHRVIWTWLPV